jgi:unspecific monooxygenase
MDVIADYATPIPVAMIAELMGIAEEDHPHLIQWSRAIVTVFDERVTAEEGQAAEQATKDFVAYVEEVLVRRRARPGDDLISAMLEVEDDGDVLTDEEIVGTVILALNAGHEATVHAIGNSLLALAQNPTTYQDARTSDIGSVVDELLRYDTPLQMFERWVLEDTDVAGYQLKKGSKVGLLFGSANHDESVFSDGEVLDVSRTPNPHVSFGAGLHYCVGAPLAKVELEAALGRFVNRVGTFDLVNVSDRIDSLVFRGVGRLEVALTPA